MAAWIKIEDIFFTYDTYLFSFHWILLNHSERKTIIWEETFVTILKYMYYIFAIFCSYILLPFHIHCVDILS